MTNPNTNNAPTDAAAAVVYWTHMGEQYARDGIANHDTTGIDYGAFTCRYGLNDGLATGTAAWVAFKTGMQNVYTAERLAYYYEAGRVATEYGNETSDADHAFFVHEIYDGPAAEIADAWDAYLEGAKFAAAVLAELKTGQPAMVTFTVRYPAAGNRTIERQVYPNQAQMIIDSERRSGGIVTITDNPTGMPIE